jgi:hypothetical protein
VRLLSDRERRISLQSDDLGTLYDLQYAVLTHGYDPWLDGLLVGGLI